jgi:hypothetical protein
MLFSQLEVVAWGTSATMLRALVGHGLLREDGFHAFVQARYTAGKSHVVRGQRGRGNRRISWGNPTRQVCQQAGSLCELYSIRAGVNVYHGITRHVAQRDNDTCPLLSLVWEFYHYPGVDKRGLAGTAVLAEKCRRSDGATEGGRRKEIHVRHAACLLNPESVLKDMPTCESCGCSAYEGLSKWYGLEHRIM